MSEGINPLEHAHYKSEELEKARQLLDDAEGKLDEAAKIFCSNKQYLSPENAFYVYMTGHMPNLKVVNIKDGKHDKSATSNRYQEIYVLHKSGMSNKDIAQVYGMKKSTIATILSRIRHNVVR